MPLDSIDMMFNWYDVSLNEQKMRIVVCDWLDLVFCYVGPPQDCRARDLMATQAALPPSTALMPNKPPHSFGSWLVHYSQQGALNRDFSQGSVFCITVAHSRRQKDTGWFDSFGLTIYHFQLNTLQHTATHCNTLQHTSGWPHITSNLTPNAKDWQHFPKSQCVAVCSL